MSPSPPPRSSTPFSMASQPASTAASSPPQTPVIPSDDEGELPSVPIKEVTDEAFEERYRRLKFLLDKSVIYTSVLKDYLETAKLKATVPTTTSSSKKSRKSNKRSRAIQSEDEEELPLKRTRIKDGDSSAGPNASSGPRLAQPALVTGGKLKDYQLEGVEWMISLDQNGISGILADEMGLGKTLQTIAFNAYLRERGCFRPLLIICPLSVLNNWFEEFQKFAPAIPACIYHGTPEERAELRRTVLRNPDEPVKHQPKHRSRKSVSGHNEAVHSASKKAGKRSSSLAMGGRRSSRPPSLAEFDDESDAVALGSTSKETQSRDSPAKHVREKGEEVPPDDPSKFPVVLTTYEIMIRDRVYLAQYHWSYVVVDEGHRLKNFDCRLMHEMRKLKSDGRLVLSGTPLQNNLAELWSLLNFILPDIFTSLKSFEEWFDLPTLQSTLSPERSAELIHTLHAILKPFLLRRLKSDVERDMPPKKEYILYAPLTQRQKDIYDAIVAGTLRRLLIKKEEDKANDSRAAEADKPDGKRKLRGRASSYAYIEEDDDEWFAKIDNGEADHDLSKPTSERKAGEIGLEYQDREALRRVNKLKLQNIVMQLRKICSHPFLFDWPLERETMQPVINEELVRASGKMMVLERLLDELLRRKHKVLIFSQFTTMLDIIEDWAVEFKGWNLCRIDGSTSPSDRREQMHRFQDGVGPDAPSIFLLSTRAGGLGINLVAADTVIFYDSDWNPQMDLQAQDRAHRIGQTRPVLIFRLLTKHTIEEKILEKASAKRKLEALVIAKGKFKMPAAMESRGKKETMAEMAAALLKLDGKGIEVVPTAGKGKEKVISDEDLDALLDRSPEVFAERASGWASKMGEEKAAAAFKVYDAPIDEGNDALANMMGEETEC